MTLYSQNPNLKFKTVTTVNGETEYRKNTKFIKNQYYIINKDCFEVDGNWYRKDGGIIVFDEEKKEWLKKKDKHLFHGIVNFENGKPVMGYFSTNLYNNCMVRSDEYGTVPAINTKILSDNGYFEDIGLGIWYNRKSVTPSTYKRMITIRNEKSYTDRGYNIEDNPSDFQQKIQSFKDYPMKLSKNVTSYAKLLGSTTFGAEIEVAKGYLPDHIQNRTSIVVCRDGSIGGGPEFVTTPLSGAKGLQNLPIIAEEVSKRCEVDINCSFHLHLGGVQDDRSFIVSMYVLALKLQDEMFKMFPYYKTDPTGVKKKNYNNKLKKMSIHPLLDCSKDGYNAYIEDVYNKIFKFLSDGVDANESYNRISRRHPVSQKWNRSSRYYWLNLMNMIFSQRNTVEFRIHSPTTNGQRMVNWLFICNAILRYAQHNAKHIITTDKPITLADVLNYYTTYFPENPNSKFLVDYLNAYIDERKKAFEKDYKNGDVISKWEMTGDKDYVFTYKGVSKLF